MPQIDRDSKLLTVLIVFSVEPHQQKELIASIEQFLTTVRTQPGFISASLHRSLDGTRIVNYAQWRSQADYAAFLSNAQVQAQASFLSHFVPETHLYEVVWTETGA